MTLQGRGLQPPILYSFSPQQVTTYTKEFRTGGDMVPIQAMEYNEENPHVQDSVKMTIQDWNVVNRR